MTPFRPSSPRRNPRRRTTFEAPPEAHVSTGPGSQQGGYRPDDWLHLCTLAEQMTLMVTAHVHKWSADERLRVGAAFRAFAELCMVDPSPSDRNDACTCNFGHGLQQDGIRPDDWFHLYTFAEQVTLKVTPHLYKWSTTERLRVAAAFRAFADMCESDQE
ncbi:hypothetical protein A4X13_0g3820 [Tilletia indica]|uniref:Uncharacterized protein n=1 Tax=Tilletia indica TaxID=43049 RepID=A0A177TF38_9BASI|nr:hypothetical protein A4X13_0g3820 [Tilletia indica]